MVQWYVISHYISTSVTWKNRLSLAASSILYGNVSVLLSRAHAYITPAVMKGKKYRNVVVFPPVCADGCLLSLLSVYIH